MWRRHATRATAVVVAAFSALGGTAFAASSSSTPGAAALIARVERVYRGVPGVRLAESASGKHASEVYDLKSGIVTALQVEAPDGSGTGVYVSRTATAGYVKGPTSKCWTATPEEQLPADIGGLSLFALHPFVGFLRGFNGATVHSAGGDGWVLTSTAKYPGGASLITSLTVSKSLHLERWSLGTAHSIETVAFDTLAVAPTVDRPRPLC